MHPPRGTCVPGCERYGFCHCGCGERSGIATRYREGIVRGRPMVYARYHQHRSSRNARRGVPLRRVWDDLGVVYATYRSQRRMAAALGMTQAYVCHMLKGRVRNISLVHAQRISALARGTRVQADRDREAERARQRRVA